MNLLAGLRDLCFAALSLFLAASGLGAAAELPRKFTETIKGTQKRAPGKTASFEMVLIPGGKFLMGSPMDEEDRKWPRQNNYCKLDRNRVYYMYGDGNRDSAEVRGACLAP